MTISPTLIEVAKSYLAMVDEPDGHMGTPERDAERTLAHEALMDELEDARIPFSSRFEARWIARWLASGHCEMDYPEPRVMWAGEKFYRGDILYANPPDDNKAGMQPVMVIIMPFTYQPFVSERNLK